MKEVNSSSITGVAVIIRPCNIGPTTRRTLQVRLRDLPPLDEDPEAFLAGAKAIGQAVLPISILHMLLTPNWDVLKLRGLPIGDPGPTPRDGRRPLDKPDWVSEGVLTMVGMQLGQLGALDGALVHEITPIAGMEDSNAGSLAPLNLCSEPTFLEQRPDHLALIALRSDPEGSHTMVARAANIVRALPPEVIEDLQMERYVFGSQRSERRPILVKTSDQRWAIRASRYGVGATDSRSARALGRLRRVLADPAVVHPVPLVPGDVVVLPNGPDSVLVLQGRRKRFRDDTSDRDWWLQRAFVYRDLKPLRKASSAKGTGFRAANVNRSWFVSDIRRRQRPRRTTRLVDT